MAYRPLDNASEVAQESAGLLAQDDTSDHPKHLNPDTIELVSEQIGAGESEEIEDGA